jgi:hypothetical protein
VQSQPLLVPVIVAVLGTATVFFAIYLKEVVVQRRVVAWQLHAYLEGIRANSVRHPLLFRLFESVGKSVDTLRTAKSKNSFHEEWEKQNSSFQAIVSQLKEKMASESAIAELTKLLDEAGCTQESLKRSSSQCRTSLNWMIEGKTFLTDKDSAVLGRGLGTLAIGMKQEGCLVLLYGAVCFDDLVDFRDESQRDFAIKRLRANAEFVLAAARSYLKDYFYLRHALDLELQKGFVRRTIDALAQR